MSIKLTETLEEWRRYQALRTLATKHPVEYHLLLQQQRNRPDEEIINEVLADKS